MTLHGHRNVSDLKLIQKGGKKKIVTKISKLYVPISIWNEADRFPQQGISWTVRLYPEAQVVVVVENDVWSVVVKSCAVPRGEYDRRWRVSFSWEKFRSRYRGPSRRGIIRCGTEETRNRAGKASCTDAYGTGRAAESSKRGLSVLHVSKHFPALDVTQYST